MFTGIVEEVGTIAAVEPLGNGVGITIRASLVLEGLGLGDSISIDGACQTVTPLLPDGFTVQVAATPLGRTTFGPSPAPPAGAGSKRNPSARIR